MKKIILLLIVLIIGLNSINAKPVDVTTAQKVAQIFFSGNGQANNFSLIYTEKVNDGSAAYFVFNSNNGFIIISGDDAALPVLGYSTEGLYDTTNLSPSFVKWMEGYKQQILYIKANNLQADDNIITQWQTITLNPFEAARATSVNPLLGQIEWNQNPYENRMCPTDNASPSGHAVTGCPATAMAQIMKYWNYPTQGTGFHSYNHNTYGTLSANFGNTTYDWANMPNYLSANSSNTEVNAVAKLMYHCGVAVEMGYGPTLSASYIIIDKSPTPEQSCEYAYKTYFGYDPTSLQGVERIYYSYANWISLLKTELDASRPIQYAGFGGGSGHTFVCDGYDVNDFFHMNWGWGGQLNGYFELDGLNPGGGGTGAGEGTYNQGQQAVIGIKPVQSTNNSDLQLYSTVNVSPGSITTSTAFSVTVDLANLGTTSFTGNIAAAVFTNDGVFVDYVQLLPNETLANGFFNTYTFNSNGMTLIPGTHILAIYSSTSTDSTWTLINQATFTNPVNLTVSGPFNDLKVYSAITVSTDPIIQNKAFTITADVSNEGLTNYNGWISADIYDSDGNWIQTIDEISNVNLAAGFYSTGTFTSTGLSLTPGTYYIALSGSPDYTNWTLLSNDYYDNPIIIDIVAPGLLPDKYENNNNKGSSYALNLTFSGNNSTKKTTGSNIHIGSDIDYYKIVLAPGFDYLITARTHDSYNSGNGSIYTCDVKFLYSVDNGANWSDSYDDIMPNNISNSNGGTIFFKVSPYFVGFTGSYLLDLSITKSSIGTAINEIDTDNTIKIFPVPTSDVLSLEIKNSEPNSGKIKIENSLGQIIKEFQNQNLSTGLINFDVSDLPNGIYFIQIPNGKSESINKKFIINR